jgi:5'-3' exoribonuclease 1
MEPFHLPTLDGLHLVEGLCEGVALGAEALAGFPSLNTLPHTAQIGFHGVSVHGSESRNKSMVVHIENLHENKKVEDIAGEKIGKRIFVGWPFLQEGLVVAVSDSLLRYEKMVVIPGSRPKVISNPHPPHWLHHWKSKAHRIEDVYSKKCGVITGSVDVLLHVRPLKGFIFISIIHLTGTDCLARSDTLGFWCLCERLRRSRQRDGSGSTNGNIGSCI